MPSTIGSHAGGRVRSEIVTDSCPPGNIAVCLVAVRTKYPALSSADESDLPTKPDAPVTRMRFNCNPRSTLLHEQVYVCRLNNSHRNLYQARASCWAFATCAAVIFDATASRILALKSRSSPTAWEADKFSHI